MKPAKWIAIGFLLEMGVTIFDVVLRIIHREVNNLELHHGQSPIKQESRKRTEIKGFTQEL